MVPPWRGGLATALVTALTVALVILDVVNRGVRRFWQTHSFTTDTVAGLLVLAITVLVVNQIVYRHQRADRSRAVAAQAAIVLGQAARAVRAVQSVRDGHGDRQSAGDDVRTYLLVLLVGAPVLIEDPVGRTFLEEAQALAAEMTIVVAPSELKALTDHVSSRGLDESVERLRAAAAPLISLLTTDERAAVTSHTS